VFKALSASQQNGHWKVIAREPSGGIVAERSFEKAVIAADYVEHVSRCLLVDHAVSIEPTAESPGFAPTDQIQIYMDPVVGKADILETVKRRELLSPQVNRHLVEHRPLGLKIPLSILTNTETFDRFLDGRFRSGSPTLVNAGTRYDGRVYEEAVIVFQT